MPKKITFKEFTDLIAASSHTTLRMSDLFVRELFNLVAETLATGKDVTVAGLGRFSVRRVDAADPAAPLSHRQTVEVLFTPEKRLADAANRPFASFKPVALGEALGEQLPDGLVGDELWEAVSRLAGVSVAEESSEVSPAPEEPAEESENAEKPPSPDISEPPEPPAAFGPEPKRQAEIQPSIAVDAPSMPWWRVELSPFWRGVLSGVGLMLLGIVVYTLWPSHGSQQPDGDPDSADSLSTAPTTAVSAAQAAVVVDSLRRGEGLSDVAARHYGSGCFWVYLYDENRAVVKDPDNVPPGTRLVIPPAQKYAIDARNAASVDSAKRRAYDIYRHRYNPPRPSKRL